MPVLVTPLPPPPAAIVAEIDRVRAQHGLAKLVVTKSLKLMARAHDRDMLQTGVMSHDGEGTNFFGRVRRHTHYRGVGETIAWTTGHATAWTIVRMWLKSPPHRSQLLNPIYQRIGVNTARGQLGSYGSGVVVTADLATRS